MEQDETASLYIWMAEQGLKEIVRKTKLPQIIKDRKLWKDSIDKARKRTRKPVLLTQL